MPSRTSLVAVFAAILVPTVAAATAIEGPTWHAGCHTYRAGYTQDGDRITIGPPVSTRKMCSGEGVMAQEQEFLAALESVKTWAIIQGGLLDMHRARALTAHPRSGP